MNDIDRAIKLKLEQIADARGWVSDIKEMMAEGVAFEREEIHNAVNYVVLLQDDLRKLEQQK